MGECARAIKALYYAAKDAFKPEPTTLEIKTPERIVNYLVDAGWKRTPSGWWWADPRNPQRELTPLEAFGVQAARDSNALFR